MKRFERNPVVQKKVLHLFGSAALGILLRSGTDSSKTPFRRIALEADLAFFNDPERITQPLRGTSFHKQALQEWKQVQDSPFFPIPLLEDALSREWEELPVDPEGIIKLFHQAVDELEKQASSE